MDQTALLEAARSGDADAFGRLVGGHRAELLAHCYRMLGSRHDAEDALQESLVRAWRGLPAFRAGALRPWLYRIATNRCLTLIEQRAPACSCPPISSPGARSPRWPGWSRTRIGCSARRRPPSSGRASGWRSSPRCSTSPGRSGPPCCCARCSASPPPRSPPSSARPCAAVNSSLQRARAALAERQPAPGDPVPPGDDTIKALADRYAAAWEAADVDTIVALLTEGATYSMPPLPEWYRGRTAIRDFLLAGPLQHRWRLRPAHANGQLAFGTYLWDEGRDAYVWGGLDLLRLDGSRIAEVVSFLTDGLSHDFGLPAELR